jgi:hypothetical protein
MIEKAAAEREHNRWPGTSEEDILQLQNKNTALADRSLKAQATVRC